MILSKEDAMPVPLVVAGLFLTVFEIAPGGFSGGQGFVFGLIFGIVIILGKEVYQELTRTLSNQTSQIEVLERELVELQKRIGVESKSLSQSISVRRRLENGGR